MQELFWSGRRVEWKERDEGMLVREQCEEGVTIEEAIFFLFYLRSRGRHSHSPFIFSYLGFTSPTCSLLCSRFRANCLNMIKLHNKVRTFELQTFQCRFALPLSSYFETRQERHTYVCCLNSSRIACSARNRIEQNRKGSKIMSQTCHSNFTTSVRK